MYCELSQMRLPVAGVKASAAVSVLLKQKTRLALLQATTPPPPHVIGPPSDEPAKTPSLSATAPVQLLQVASGEAYVPSDSVPLMTSASPTSTPFSLSRIG